jgi:histidinol-phosphatase
MLKLKKGKQWKKKETNYSNLSKPTHGNNMSEELKVAIKAAKKGAEYALKYFGKDLEFSKKSDNTILTRIDKETEELIKKIILNKFPDAKFVGEETGGIPNKGKFWTIDPIDGTRHFIKNTPLWAVLISLVIDGVPVIGVSNVPCLKEVIYAEKGKGVFLNDKKIEVSKTVEIKDSILMLGSLRFFKEKISTAIKFINVCASTRSLVSPYEYHLLSSGRCEIVLDAYGKIWDIAPFKVIVEEAGGEFVNWNGKPWTIKDSGCIATNKMLFKDVMKIINNSA